MINNKAIANAILQIMHEILRVINYTKYTS